VTPTTVSLFCGAGGESLVREVVLARGEAFGLARGVAQNWVREPSSEGTEVSRRSGGEVIWTNATRTAT
jgi:hypothetical protein